MKKVQIIGLALFAVFAFSTAAVTSSAFALEYVLASWLVNGKSITKAEGALPSEGKGELLLEDVTKKGAIVCSGILDGTIGPESLDEITKVLNLSTVEIGELTGKGLECKGQTTCETGSEAWPAGLPWLTELELMEPEGTWWVLIFKAGYHVLCLALGGLINEEVSCTAAEGAATQALNVTGGVELGKETTPNGSCEGGTENAVQSAIAGNLLTSSSGAVTVSE